MNDATRDRFERLEGLFHQALNVPAGEDREAFLQAVRGDDPTLTEEVRGLLAKDGEVQAGSARATTGLPRFGPYQARELIGRGGMGAVYLATREDGEVRIKVAIKVIASQFWSSALEERFRRERQILAQMRHPNIASFLDGGVSAEGLPFLVMEYVEGERFDRYCDSRRLSVNRRLELFLRVCAAVSFAHQQLVVHRDVKPGNIVVDSSGEPKLLDFGVARTLEAQGDQTATIGYFMTPLYSSPEVLRGKPAAVTDDVYSLGVLLYEQVRGRRPFGSADSPPAELIDAVLNTEPRRASDTDGPDTEEAAAQRGETSASLRRKLRGDLDVITAKAMAKSAGDRYSSVNELAEDVGNYLAGRPVRAAAGNSLYRVRKFVARHKAGAAAAAIVALSLIAGVTATLWQAGVARQQRAAAERRFSEARELARYIIFDLQTAVRNLQGSTPIRAEMVSRSLTYLDRLAAEQTNDESLRTELGQSYVQLADVLGNPFLPNLGDVARARESYRKAIAILEPVAAKSPDNRQARVFLARAKLMLGRSLGFSAKSPEGRKLIDDAAREFGRLAARWPSDFQVRYHAAVAFDSLAHSLGLQGGYVSPEHVQPALDASRQSVENAQAALRLKPNDLDTLSQLAISYKFTGDLTELRDRPGATPFYREALAALDRIGGSGKESIIVLSARSSALLGLGWNLGNLGQFKEALAALEEARQIRDRLSEQDPKNVMALFFRVTPYRNLAIVNENAGNIAASRENFLAAIAIYDLLLQRSPSNRNYRLGRAELQTGAANHSVKLHLLADAERLAREGIGFLKEAAQSPDASPVELVIAARSLLESQVVALCDYSLALAFAKRASILGGDDSEMQEVLAEAYWRTGDRDGAIRAIEKALSLIERKPTPVRDRLEKTLAEYRSGKLPSARR